MKHFEYMQIILDYIWSNFFINEILLEKNNKSSLKISILFSFYKYNLFIFKNKQKFLNIDYSGFILSGLVCHYKKIFSRIVYKGKIIIKK